MLSMRTHMTDLDMLAMQALEYVHGLTVHKKSPGRRSNGNRSQSQPRG